MCKNVNDELKSLLIFSNMFYLYYIIKLQYEFFKEFCIPYISKKRGEQPSPKVICKTTVYNGKNALKKMQTLPVDNTLEQTSLDFPIHIKWNTTKMKKKVANMFKLGNL